MSAVSIYQMPVGVRAVTGERTGRLTWVSVEAFDTSAAGSLERGSRVLVRDTDGDREWFGEVVVLPVQLLESPPLSALPILVRLATEADPWPATPDRAGWALLESLGLPADLLEPTAS